MVVLPFFKFWSQFTWPQCKTSFMKYQSENGRQPAVSPNKMRLRSLAGVEEETLPGEE